jgi:hypothetical protein
MGGDSHSSGPLHDTPEDWVASRDHTAYGSGQLRLVNATHAFWERLIIDRDDDEAETGLRDPVWFVNHHTKQ